MSDGLEVYKRVARKLGGDELGEERIETLGRLLMRGHGLIWEVADEGVAPYTREQAEENIRNCWSLWQLMVHGKERPVKKKTNRRPRYR